MNIEKLTDKNFYLFCAKHYNSRLSSTTEEFIKDLQHIKYIRKLIIKFQETGVLKERLLLNHFIILSNVFEPEICCKILYFKLKDLFEYIKPFLIMLNILPDIIYNVGEEEIIYVDDIKINIEIVNKLRKI